MEQITRLTSYERETILRQVLRKHNIPESAFSIGASAEQRVCLEKENGRYHVYIMERGVVFEESQHTTEASAHLEMLNQLAESKDEYHQMCRTYENLVNMKSKRLVGVTKRGIVGSNENPAIKRPAFNIHAGDVVRVCLKPSMSGQGKEVKGVVIHQRREKRGIALLIQKDIQGIKYHRCIILKPYQIDTIEVVQSAESHRQESGYVDVGIKKAARIKGKLKR